MVAIKEGRSDRSGQEMSQRERDRRTGRYYREPDEISPALAAVTKTGNLKRMCGDVYSTAP